MSAQRFENYEIRTKPDGTAFELGRGAMGVTYKAVDLDLHRDVALKVINPGIIGGPDAEERFLREARAAAKFRHPNIASIFRLGKTADGTNFYAMEFCEGPTLEQAVAERGPLPAEEAVGIVLQIARALVLAEQHNLIHRDLKPANLILTESHGEGTVVKVIDFGLAKNFADGMQTLSTMGTAGFAGTAHFASPEQLEESELDIRSDIFSLGVCLWFMLTGKPPFEGSLARVMSQMLSSEFPWDRLTGQPPAVVKLLQRMVAKDKTGRPENAAVLKSEIETCLGGHPPVAILETQPPAPSPVAPRTVEEFEARFHLEEAVGNDAFGRIFRARDRVRGEVRVAVRAIDPLLTVVPAVRREILGQLTAALARPHGNLQNPLCFISSEEGVFVASEWTDGFTLLDLLKHRGAVAPCEALALLSPLAAAADHAVKHGLGGLNFSKDQIHVHFPNDYDKGRAVRYLEESQGEWPEHQLKAGVLSLDAGSNNHGVLASMATIAPSSSKGGVILAVVPSLANVACELLGGRGGEVFAPLPRLSEAGNGVLRRAFSDPSAYASATAFLQELKATVETSGGTSVVPRSATQLPGRKPAAPAGMPPAAKKKSASAVAAIAVLILVGGGAGYYFGIQKPREEAREERNQKDEDRKKPAEGGTSAVPNGIPGGAAAPAPGMPVHGGPAQKSQQAFVPDSAEWETLAANGDAFAQALLGERGVFASSVPGDEMEKGVGWLSKSANQKHPLGMFLLAEQSMRKKEGDHPGEKTDFADETRMFGLAIQLGFEKDAERGGIVWQAALGRAYDGGLGVIKDSNKAVSLLTSAARNGHVFSQFLLGGIYQNEPGGKADMQQASKWYGMAAQSGFPAAQAAVAWISIHGEKSMRDEGKAFAMASKAAKAGDVNGKVILAECHEFGYGTRQSSTEALDYYEEAAGEGNAMATGHLGRIHLQGNLVSEDDDKALRLLKESHDAGNKLVCGLLGSMYEDGKAGTKNIDTAVEYYKEGARAGDLYSKAALGICSMEGKGVPKDPKVAMTFFEEAALGGISDSQYRLGVLLQRGEGVRNDLNKAAGWLEKAASQKHPLGVFEWARCLEKGVGTSKKEIVALKLYEDLAKTGFAEAAFRAGLMFESGRGVPVDLKSAIGSYTLAAEAGDPSAQVNLGILHSQGNGLPQNDSKALELYRKAAAKEDIDAFFLLGMMSEFGKGTARDPAEAARWYRKAADKGDEEAKNRIKNLHL